jgi:hypothetical protein
MLTHNVERTTKLRMLVDQAGQPDERRGPGWFGSASSSSLVGASSNNTENPESHSPSGAS